MYLVLNDINVDPTVDQYTIIGCSGIGLVRIIKKDGFEEHVHLKGSKTDPRVMEQWNPEQLSSVDRHVYISKLLLCKISNQQIAALLNISQASLCHDLKHILSSNG